MKIEESIRNHFKSRLETKPVLVVYDPDRCYQGIINKVCDEDCTVIDGSTSTILAREQAMDAWRSMAADETGKKRLIVYLPIPRPITDKARQMDPYQMFALGGGEFPHSDGETFQALCHQAAPELAAQIDALFAHGAPDFDTVNTLIAKKATWPKIKTLLQAESAIEILAAVMSPSGKQETALKGDKAWVTEFKEFLKSTLGMKLLTSSSQWSTISDEVWRFILFSEFVFDLPCELPGALKDVPKAHEINQSLIYNLCDHLRDTESLQQRYMDMADKVAAELQLEKHMEGVADLGSRDTFAFEERTFLMVFSKMALGEQFDEAEEIFHARKISVWVNHTSERRLLWTIADRALQLFKHAMDMSDALSSADTSLSGLFHFYCDRFRNLDRLHRGFEQAVTDVYGELGVLEDLVDVARARYKQAAEKLHSIFTHAVQKEGWPVSGQLGNTDVFDAFVAPWLEKRKKVAYFLVDALRYELAVELENELAGSYTTQVTPVCAQLPTTTPVGMASLMPGAKGNLYLKKDNDSLVPFVKDKKVEKPQDRLDYISSLYGDRCHMRGLDELLQKPKMKIPETTQLLIIKTVDIDSYGEMTPIEAQKMIPRVLQKIIAGVNKVQKKGFDRVVIATDHGFVLLDDQAIGDVAPKPAGEWLLVKDRCLLGKGSAGHGVIAFHKDEVGIAGDFEDYVVPKTFATFAKGNLYFHEGLSLEECVLPVITIDFAQAVKKQEKSSVRINLSYKGGTTSTITTRRPMIEVVMFDPGLFDEVTFDFHLAAYAGSEVVGEVGTCEHVNPATNLVTIKPGQAIKVPLKMGEEFQGSFEVRAVSPETKVNFATLNLSTDYME